MKVRGILLLILCFVAALYFMWPYGTHRFLAYKLVGADQIIATDRSEAKAPVSIVITGNQVQSIIQAVGTASRNSQNYAQAFCQTVDFYRGESLVGSIRVGEHLFLIGNAQYQDNTGYLPNLVCRPLYLAKGTQHIGAANAALPHR